MFYRGEAIFDADVAIITPHYTDTSGRVSAYNVEFFCFMYEDFNEFTLEHVFHQNDKGFEEKVSPEEFELGIAVFVDIAKDDKDSLYGGLTGKAFHSGKFIGEDRATDYLELAKKLAIKNMRLIEGCTELDRITLVNRIVKKSFSKIPVIVEDDGFLCFERTYEVPGGKTKLYNTNEFIGSLVRDWYVGEDKPYFLATSKGKDKYMLLGPSADGLYTIKAYNFGDIAEVDIPSAIGAKELCKTCEQYAKVYSGICP